MNDLMDAFVKRCNQYQNESFSCSLEYVLNEVENIEPETIPHNKSCEYHGQNVEIEVLDTWVYPKSKIIELRCIDICKQCGEGYGKIYSIFADKFVKEV